MTWGAEESCERGHHWTVTPTHLKSARAAGGAVSSCQCRIQANGCKSGLRNAREKSGQHLENDGRAGARARGVSVVQQQNVAGGKAARETHVYGLRIAVHRVKSTPRPTCEQEIEARQNGIEQGAAQASRSAKKQRPSTGDGADGLLRPFNLTGERSRPEQRKIVEMPVAMILNGMAAPHDLAREFGKVLDAPADAEKRGFDCVLVEKVEHLRSDRRVRTIIDAERDFTAARGGQRQARQVRPEQSAARPKARRGELHMIEDDRAERPWPKTGPRERQCRCAHVQRRRGFEKRRRAPA